MSTGFALEWREAEGLRWLAWEGAGVAAARVTNHQPETHVATNFGGSPSVVRGVRCKFTFIATGDGLFEAARACAPPSASRRSGWWCPVRSTARRCPGWARPRRGAVPAIANR